MGAWCLVGRALMGIYGTQVLDTVKLLRSCIQEAVGLLQDPPDSGQRSMRRVDILLGLLTEEPPEAGRTCPTSG